MINCLVYIFIIFLISLLLVLCIDETEGFNAQKITLETIQKDSDPSLAGSIDYKYTDPKMEEEDSSYKIYNPDEYHNLMKNNRNFKEEKKMDKTTNVINYGKFFDERNTDYYTYETILPPMKFIKPSLVQDLTNQPVIQTNITRDFSNNNEKIYGLDELDPENDCLGKWLPWDESNCPDSRDRCSLKFREYKVITEKKSTGKECTYEGDIINDGDIEYDYCFGSGHEDRCGLTDNVCECDLDNYEADECEVESTEEKCMCPAGTTLSGEGKCVSGSGTNIPGINNLTQDQVDQLIVMLNSSGTNITQVDVNSLRDLVNRGQGQGQGQGQNMGIMSILRLAYAEGELEEAKRIEERVMGVDISDVERKARQERYRESQEYLYEEIEEELDRYP